MRTGNPTLNANTFENFGVYRQAATAAPASARSSGDTATAGIKAATPRAQPCGRSPQP